MKQVTVKLSYDPKVILGKGSDGTKVFDGMFGFRKVAVKRIDSENVDLRDREESLLLLGDSHDNIVNYYSTEAHEEFIFIALEICDFDLSQYFPQNSDPAPTECLLNLRETFQVNEILKQTTDGLKFLHSIQIIHRDIKPQNILVKKLSDGEWKVKISDFGIAKILRSDRSQTKLTRPSKWPDCAPLEVLNDRISGKSSDIYSLGCFFFFMISGGFYPFCVMENYAGFWSKNQSAAWNSFSSVVTDEIIFAIDLIAKMVNENPHQRPTAERILNHGFFWDSNKKMEFLKEVAMLLNIKDDNVTHFVSDLNANAPAIVGNWEAQLHPVLKIDIKKRAYQFDSVASLLRYIRNKKTHFVDESNQELKDVFGVSEDDVIIYFIRIFPRLVAHVFEVVTRNQNMFQDDFKKKYLKFYQ